MASVSDNPFAILTAVVAPAILTNACTVLTLGTSNRLGRVMDRMRVISKDLIDLKAGTRAFDLHVSQLERQKVRANMLFRALRIFYASLGAFGTAALLSIIGSALTIFEQRFAFHAIAAIALAVGTFGVAALVTGCVVTVRETRLAIQNIAEEAEVASAHYLAIEDKPQ